MAAHRIPTFRNIKPRPIIVKFLRREMQERVVRARSKLKGTKVVIYEDLCRELQLVLNRLHKDDRVKASWSWRGNIYMSDPNSKRMEVRYGDSLDRLLAESPKEDQITSADNDVGAMDQTDAKVVDTGVVSKTPAEAK